MLFICQKEGVILKIEIDLTSLNLIDIEYINISIDNMRVKGYVEAEPFVEAEFLIPIGKDNKYFKLTK